MKKDFGAQHMFLLMQKELLRKKLLLKDILRYQIKRFLYHLKCLKQKSIIELLDLVCNIVERINQFVPCRCLLVECRKSSKEESIEMIQKRNKLHQLYIDYGFTAIQETDNHIQYVLII